VKKIKAGNEKLLTDVELELMSILWNLGEGSVSDVLDQLPAGRSLAYTSVSTILRILEQKGVLKNRKEGRGHVYIPILKKADYEAKAVRHVVEKVFEGTPIALVRQLLNSGDLGKTEIEELKALLAKAEEKK
jgi:predicted transcriptional regulator